MRQPGPPVLKFWFHCRTCHCGLGGAGVAVDRRRDHRVARDRDHRHGRAVPGDVHEQVGVGVLAGLPVAAAVALVALALADVGPDEQDVERARSTTLPEAVGRSFPSMSETSRRSMLPLSRR